MVRRAALALVAVSAFAAGCGGTSDGDGGAAGTEPPAAASEPSEPANEVAPATTGGETAPVPDEPQAVEPAGAVPELLQVTAPAVGGGGEVDLAAYAGRPLALWFWAPG